MARELLGKYPLFKLLDPRPFDTWMSLAQELTCATGETLFQEGTPGAWVYALREGRVRVLRKASNREHTLGVLTAGEVFGEYALLPPGRNTATCRAATPVRLARLPLGPLRSLVQGMGAVWTNLKNWLRLHTLLSHVAGRSFLGFMSAESALKFVDRLETLPFAAGETIQADALAGDRWFLIEQGRVTLYERDDTQSPLTHLGPGDTFGERGLAGWGGLPLAVAATDVRARVLTRYAFESPNPTAAAQSLALQSYQPRPGARPEAHTWVPQLEEADCGLASLAMVSRRKGRTETVEELRAQVRPGPAGLTMQQMRLLALERGLACQAVRVPADRLGQVSMPAIAHLSDGHYVVLHEVGAMGVVVGDPASGIVTWSQGFLRQCYSGALLLFG